MAAVGSPMDIDTGIEVIYSGESDSPSGVKPSSNFGRGAVGAETTTAKPRGSLDEPLRHEMLASSKESEYSSQGKNRLRSHSYDASAKHYYVGHHDDIDDVSRSYRSLISPSD